MTEHTKQIPEIVLLRLGEEAFRKCSQLHGDKALNVYRVGFADGYRQGINHFIETMRQSKKED